MNLQVTVRNTRVVLMNFYRVHVEEFVFADVPANQNIKEMRKANAWKKQNVVELLK